MTGRWFGSRTGRVESVGSLATIPLQPQAGVLSCRLVDPAHEPVRQAEFTLSDPTGRIVVRGGTDPFGSLVVTVPPGEYRLAVSADGYAPYRVNTAVAESAHSSLGDVALQIAQAPVLPEAGDWEIERTHSAISFSVRHIGLARIHGRFNSFAGAIRIAERIEESAMHVVIDAASIDTNVRLRDDHLRSAEFLDVGSFPTIEFYSERLVHKGGSKWAITGAFSLHGVTRTVTLDTEYLGIAAGMQGETRVACRATTELHRDDFTVSWQSMLARGIAAVGPSIVVTLDVQIVPRA